MYDVRLDLPAARTRRRRIELASRLKKHVILLLGLDLAALVVLALTEGVQAASVGLAAISGVALATAGLLLVRGDRVREHRLDEALSLLRATLDSTADGVLVTDLEGRIITFNEQFALICGLSPEVMRTVDGRTLAALVAEHLTAPEAYLVRVAEVQGAPDVTSVDTLTFADGRVVERTVRPQLVEGRAVGQVWTFRDVTATHQLEERLAHQALHDPLTTMANRALFRDRVDHALARVQRRGGALAVLFLDLDYFKNVNDSLGHLAGDDLLVEVAKRIRACLRDSDTAARLGGDEFAVLVEDLDAHDRATAVADRLIEALTTPFTIAGRELHLSGSIGIALDDSGETSTDQLLRNADLAMYRAKARGRGRYVVFEPRMHVIALDRLELEEELRRAITNEELRLHYQVLVSLDTQAVVGVEALVRWDHPSRGLLSPETFIDIAEESELISDIGRWVLGQACRDAAAWAEDPAIPTPIRLSVNLSPRQLHDQRVVDDLSDALTLSGLAPQLLTLEITEGAMMEDTEVVIETLYALKRLGVRLAVDDFGTGYSSFAYLQRFPIDDLKVDRSFVERVEHGAEESGLAKAILQLAKVLGLGTVAEGVERPQQAAFLREHGCQHAQGFHYGRPVDSRALVELLREGQAITRPAPR